MTIHRGNGTLATWAGVRRVLAGEWCDSELAISGALKLRVEVIRA